MAVVKPFKRKLISHEPISAPLSVTGELIGVTNEGIALVDFAQNTAGPIEARSLLNESNSAQLKELPVQVLLTFENADLSKPIVMGIISETLFVPAEAKEVVQKEVSSKEHSVNLVNLDQSTDLKVDGKRMTFDAKEEILLRCGKSSILLRKNGKIVIKGANLISRSSATNKIKGSSVNIN